VAIEDRQTAPLKVWRSKRWSKKRCVLIGSLFILFFVSSISTLVGYSLDRKYNSDLLLAQTGMQHLRSGVTLLESVQSQPFAPRTVERAQGEFASALSDTQAIEASLANYAGISGFVPVYGPRLQVAMRLTALAADVSRAGISGCKVLELVLSRIGSPMQASIPGLTNADFTALSHEFQAAKTSINSALNDALLLQPGDVSFDGHLAKLLKTFQANIPTIRAALASADQLLPVLPILLGIGTPSHYLLEILDSSELRPAGGFIGSYGVATLSRGHLTSASITDVDLLDKPFKFAGHTIPYPPAYNWFVHYLAPSSWSLRDSNLDADFPTAARYGELNYQREGGNVPVQGVISITPFFIQQILNITGPISVPEYHETITAQDLVARIHFHQLGPAGEGPDYIASPDGHSSLRKRFTSYLAQYLLTRVKQLPPSAWIKFVKVFAQAVRPKDIQIYLNASAAENILLRNHLAGAIESPSGDSLMVVDANVGGNKANSFISSSVRDRVTIDSAGDATHRVTLRYAWTKSGNVYGPGLYKDYVRVYGPSESTLTKQDGWQPLGTSTAFGSRVWAGFFTLLYGQTRTITLEWTSYGAARHDAAGWHYRYVLQPQAGIQRLVELQTMLPACAVVTNKWGGVVSKNKQEVAFTQALAGDLSIGVDYMCK
jgi:Protein of unknown function (DUF4012)